MTVVEVKDVQKKFKVYFDKGRSIKERLLFQNRNRHEDRWVLKGISFQVEKGEALGLIGENGCGKSTLLKLMTKIMYSDAGKIELQGRVSSLIELGAGFHLDMSGRENIYTNASIFGLSRREIDARIKEIIDFSELWEFIDNPVRTYSSGMYMRLAFAVAINVDADILLVDEILAVGDAAFQAKCFNKMREIKAKGTTIIIVSHAMSQIEQICDRAIWIENGLIQQEGAPRDVIHEYMQWIMSRDPGAEVEALQSVEEVIISQPSDDAGDSGSSVALNFEEIRKTGEPHIFGNCDLVITSYDLQDPASGSSKRNFSIGESMAIVIHYERRNSQLREAMFSFTILRNDGIVCYATNTQINTGSAIVIQNTGHIRLILAPNLMQGNYTIEFSFNQDYGPDYYGIINAFHFSVYNTKTDYGVCNIPYILEELK